jgi:hypothetical protein
MKAFRIVLIASIFLAFTSVISVFYITDRHREITEDLLVGLGITFFGVALTVLAIEGWLKKTIENEQNHRKAAEVAWRMLSKLDQAVWVWQGGDRGFNLARLMIFFGQDIDSEPLPVLSQETVWLFENLGSDADYSYAELEIQADIFRANPKLREALNSLRNLRGLQKRLHEQQEESNPIAFKVIKLWVMPHFGSELPAATRSLVEVMGNKAYFTKSNSTERKGEEMERLSREAQRTENEQLEAQRHRYKQLQYRVNPVVM